MEKEFYITKEEFVALKEAWKAKADHSAPEIIIYNILRSKPVDNGFVPKTKNIQGRNEWYAFNEALYYAKSYCAPARLSVEDPQGLISRLTGKRANKWISDIEPTKKKFKDRFGIDMPEDIIAALGGAKK